MTEFQALEEIRAKHPLAQYGTHESGLIEVVDGDTRVANLRREARGAWVIDWAGQAATSAATPAAKSTEGNGAKT